MSCSVCINGWVTIAWWGGQIPGLKEYIARCSCRDWYPLKARIEKEESDFKTGKRQKIETLITVSRRFRDEISAPQFGWNPRMTRNGQSVHYYEFYMASCRKSIEHWKKTGEMKLLSAIEYIDKAEAE